MEIYPASSMAARLGGRALLATALVALLLAYLLGVSRASASEIVNQTVVDGTRASWLNSFTTTGEDGDRPSAKRIRVSVLVHHPPGRKVTGLRIDSDWNGSDESSIAPVVTAGLDVQQPNVTGGFNYSRVNLSYTPSTNVFTDEVDQNGNIVADTGVRVRPLNIRAVLDDGTQTPSSTSQVSFVQGKVPPDYWSGDLKPFLSGWEFAMTQTGGTVRRTPSFFGPARPGDEMDFFFSGVDPDPNVGCSGLPYLGLVCGDYKKLVGVNWRLRNQLTGGVAATGSYCAHRGNEGSLKATATIPTRGTFSLDAKLVDDDGFVTIDDLFSCNDWDYPNYFPVGSVDANSPTIPPPSASVSVQRPQVGSTISVSATMPTDPDSAAGGKVEYVEWDLDGDPATGVDGFEKTNLGDYDTGFGPGTVLSQSIDTSTLPPGPKTARVRVTDNGAMSGADAVRASSTAEVQYTVDAPPVLSSPGPQALSPGAARSIVLSATDADGDPITWSTTGGPVHGSGLLRNQVGASTIYDYQSDAGYSGPDSVTLKATDPYGGTDSETVAITMVPDTSIDAGPPQTLNTRDVEFGFSSDSDNVGFECRLTGLQEPGQDFTGCSAPKRYEQLADGSYAFEVRARSTSGDVTDPVPASWQFIVDGTAPTVKIDAAPAKLGTSRAANFAFSSTETGPFQCRLDGDEQGGTGWTGCGTGAGSSQAYTGLTEGSHTFEVRQTDQAANQGPVDDFAWIIDRTAPSVRITRKPPRTIVKEANRTKVKFEFSGEDGVTFECAIDHGAFERCSSPFAFKVKTGRHTFAVRPSDRAGNRGKAQLVAFRFKREN